MNNALKMDNVCSNEVDYVNAHATSTLLGDDIELEAIKRVFKEHKPYIGANKGLIGHCLGASGAIESGFSIMSLYEGAIPPNVNIDSPICKESLFPTSVIKKDVNFVLKNSFGFGGTNASLLFKKFKY